MFYVNTRGITGYSRNTYIYTHTLHVQYNTGTYTHTFHVQYNTGYSNNIHTHDVAIAGIVPGKKSVCVVVDNCHTNTNTMPDRAWHISQVGNSHINHNAN